MTRTQRSGRMLEKRVMDRVCKRESCVEGDWMDAHVRVGGGGACWNYVLCEIMMCVSEDMIFSWYGVKSFGS